MNQLHDGFLILLIAWISFCYFDFFYLFFDLFFGYKNIEIIEFIGTRVKIDLAKIKQKHSASRQARTATRK